MVRMRQSLWDQCEQMVRKITMGLTKGQKKVAEVEDLNVSQGDFSRKAIKERNAWAKASAKRLDHIAKNNAMLKKGTFDRLFKAIPYELQMEYVRKAIEGEYSCTTGTNDITKQADAYVKLKTVQLAWC
jgi:hypothetical protein